MNSNLKPLNGKNVLLGPVIKPCILLSVPADAPHSLTHSLTITHAATHTVTEGGIAISYCTRKIPPGCIDRQGKQIRRLSKPAVFVSFSFAACRLRFPTTTDECEHSPNILPSQLMFKHYIQTWDYLEHCTKLIFHLICVVAASPSLRPGCHNIEPTHLDHP